LAASALAKKYSSIVWVFCGASAIIYIIGKSDYQSFTIGVVVEWGILAPKFRFNPPKKNTLSMNLSFSK
jgi:hypothetical protein